MSERAMVCALSWEIPQPHFAYKNKGFQMRYSLIVALTAVLAGCVGQVPAADQTEKSSKTETAAKAEVTANSNNSKSDGVKIDPALPKYAKQAGEVTGAINVIGS